MILAVEEFGMAFFLSGMFMFFRNRSDFGTMLALPVVRVENFRFCVPDGGLLLPSKGGIFTFLCY